MTNAIKVIIIIAVITIGGYVIYAVSQIEPAEIVQDISPIESSDIINSEEVSVTPETMDVILPLAAQTPLGDFGPFGCGQYINFYTYEVPYSPAVLSAAYQKLFSLPAVPGGDILDTNVVAEQTMLSFESVTLENGIASVYLSGAILGNHCADEVLRQQIEQTAFQFDTVQTIQVFVNNEIFDWCYLSDADPSESNCDTNPRPWITNRTN